MWKRIKDTSYYIDVTIDDHYDVVVTDFVKVWSHSFSQELFINCLLEFEDNYGLEIDREELLDKGTKILLSPEKLDCAVIYEDHHHPFLIVNLYLNFGFQLGINMNLQEGPSKIFFLKVVQPLLSIVRDLKESENELRELLVKKDEEITEYKNQGGKIKYTALQPYNDTKHKEKHPCYNKFFDSIGDPQNIFNKTIEFPKLPGREAEPQPKSTSIKTESSVTVTSNQTNNLDNNCEPTHNITIKTEPSSQTVASNQTSSSRTEEPTDRIPVKVQPSSENVNNSQSNNCATAKVEVKNEFKPFLPKKKRLNI